jgi:hypothetical protein
MSEKGFYKPHLKLELEGEGGNVFAIIGNVVRVLKDNGLFAEANEFRAYAMSAGSYEEVLKLVEEYVIVEK